MVYMHMHMHLCKVRSASVLVVEYEPELYTLSSEFGSLGIWVVSKAYFLVLSEKVVLLRVHMSIRPFVHGPLTPCTVSFI
jgi:hypothetical protein